MLGMCTLVSIRVQPYFQFTMVNWVRGQISPFSVQTMDGHQNSELTPYQIRLALQNCHYRHPKSTTVQVPSYIDADTNHSSTPASLKAHLVTSLDTGHPAEGHFQVNECII